MNATPVAVNYRVLPINEAFNWPAIFQELTTKGRHPGDSPYLVVFRSVRKAGVDGAWVSQLDDAAHEEAKMSPALLHYFAGDLDEERRAMSWCLWTNIRDARTALHGAAHQIAVRSARELYDNFSIEMYDVTYEAGKVEFYSVQRR
jgi:hypothetical protein